ncbi:MAG: MaoC family dehydratase N-terminal domain-containing protein [Chloroflexi bacterium]|nr:MaoC family dehydratase N-terminal domain-containing protein [Chloroflexota bacterium]
MTTTEETKLTPEVKAMIGVRGEFVESSWWIVEKEGLRRFTQALMDPDPRYWDEEFAKTTRYGEIITPPIYVSYLGKTPPYVEDPITAGFKKNPVSDGLGDLGAARRGALPRIPTDLVRNLNAGNEIEMRRFPSLGDRIYSQGGYYDIQERVGRDGAHMLIVTNETNYYNQRGELLCTTRQSGIRR